MQNRRRNDDVTRLNGGTNQVIHYDTIGIHRHVWPMLLGTSAERNDHDRRLSVSALGLGPAQISEMNAGRLSPDRMREQQNASKQKNASDQHHTLRFDLAHIMRARLHFLQADERSISGDER